MDEPLTCQTFPTYLEQRFPDYLAMIWKVRSANHPGTVTAASLVGEVFVDCVYADGVKGNDEELLARWFETVERALSGPDDMLRKFFEKYVEPIVLNNDRRAGWTQGLGRPLLRARLDAAVGASWQHQVGGFALSVWPVHKAGEAGSIDAWPVQPLPVSDWLDASEFGTAVLTAFQVATINGSSMPQ